MLFKILIFSQQFSFSVRFILSVFMTEEQDVDDNQ